MVGCIFVRWIVRDEGRKLHGCGSSDLEVTDQRRNRYEIRFRTESKSGVGEIKKGVRNPMSGALTRR